MDETKQKIMDATMMLVREKGYISTTTKDIAKHAHVNECTIFRKFKSKKDIILCAMEQTKWRANISPAIFKDITWNLQEDLEMFMCKYLERMTEDFVKVSIGLRAPQIYEETAPMIMKVPEAFINSLVDYFEQMYQKGKIENTNFECLAMSIFSSTFGFVFLKASFNENLSMIKQEQYIKESAMLFANGIQKIY